MQCELFLEIIYPENIKPVYNFLSHFFVLVLECVPYKRANFNASNKNTHCHI
jgi:hypothetical protein